MSVKIRKMQPEDAAFIAEIEKECFSQPWSEKGILDTYESGQSLFLVAELDGMVAGYVGMTYAADEGEIANIAVTGGARRRGIAEELMRELSRHAIALGICYVFLDVRVGNEPAIELYEKMKYEQCGRRRRFYEKPVEDAFIYRLQLEAAQ